MERGSFPALLGLTAFLILASPASAGRHCRYEGRIFNQGDMVCINVDGRTRLARCGMMLNNASWNFIQDGCPTAALKPLAGGRPTCNGRPRPIASANRSTTGNHVIVP